MAEPAAATTSTATDDKSTLNVPADIAAQFGDLIELIKNSRSMDDSERQYWVDVLPIMSEDQVQNLRGILDNEKKQLAEAEAAYNEDTEDNFLKTTRAFDEEAYKEKKRARIEAEKLQEKKEVASEEAILHEIENL